MGLRSAAAGPDCQTTRHDEARRGRGSPLAGKPLSRAFASDIAAIVGNRTIGAGARPHSSRQQNGKNGPDSPGAPVGVKVKSWTVSPSSVQPAGV